MTRIMVYRVQAVLGYIGFGVSGLRYMGFIGFGV